MDTFIKAVLTALEEAGIPAMKRLPSPMMPRLTGPRAAVGFESIKAAQGAAYDYLGTEETEEYGQVERYGRRMEAVLLVRVFAPDGAEVGDKVALALARGFDGVTVKDISAKMAGFDPVADCFVTEVRAEISAYLYAVGGSDEETFLDFRLEGEAK